MNIKLQSNNFNWTLHKNDSITNHLLSNKLWEEHVLKFMRLWIKNGDYCLDIGSCFGWHTWSPWEQYEHKGPAIYDGKQIIKTERRQRRLCVICHKEQDEWIRCG